MGADDVKLEEIRENFDTDTAEWAAIRKHGSDCMKAIAGDPWKDTDRRARENANRPCISLDELSQYVNQVDNDLKQNKRGIKVSPVGNGANEKTASTRQGLIRQIEYRSNAQQAYGTMAQNAIMRGYGALRVCSKYVSEAGLDQELTIEPIVNPDMLTVDPFALKQDGSDMRHCFFHESLSHKEFKREYPGAKVQDFALDGKLLLELQSWVTEKRVTVAEYWEKSLDKERRKLWLKPGGRTEQNPDNAPIEMYEDEITGHKPSSDSIMGSRAEKTYKVKHYVTNGLEILKEEAWPGKSIPFVTMYGKVLYVNVEGTGSRRKVLSLVSLALEPYMLYCYIRTCEAEMVGMVTKFPYFYYRGQLSPASIYAMAQSLHEPVAGIEVEPTVDGIGAGTVLPFPERNLLAPDLAAYEGYAEAARRAIQAAIGMGFLPTAAQRHSEKSGVALERIKESGQLGSFHFADNFNSSITRTGQILDENLPYFYDTARDVTIRDEKDDPQDVRINDPGAMQGDQPAHIDMKQGDHDVNLSVGPAMANEREANSAFADAIVATPQIAQAIGPQKFAELLAAAIRLKGVGPIGDEMAEIISPKPKEGEMDPRQMAQQLQQMQAAGQEMQQQLQQAGKIIETKQIENQSKEKIEQMRLSVQMSEGEKERALKLAIAHINAAAKGAALDAHAQEETLALGAAAVESMEQRAHEVGLQAMGHGQALEASQQDAGEDADLSEQSHGQALQQGQQGHQQALEQGDASHAQALEQGAQAAALAPQPEAT